MTDVEPSQAVAAASDAAQQTQLVLTSGGTLAQLVAGGHVPAVRVPSTSNSHLVQLSPPVRSRSAAAAATASRGAEKPFTHSESGFGQTLGEL
jgi:hypothetical protein